MAGAPYFEEVTVMGSETSRSWFCVFNNPADHDYPGTPQEVCERLRDEWIKDSETRSGAWVYCISADGLHHVHMVLEDTKSMRFSAIKSSYCKGMHFEPTKGTKRQVEDYIEKRGAFEEKGEQIICKVVHGEIKGKQGRRSDISRFYDLIQDGVSLSQILDDNPAAWRYKAILKDMYFTKKDKETPAVRDVRVYWHTGETGTGKSYSRIRLMEERGEDDVYFLTTFGSGAFDNYAGQSVLWIEDYRGEFPFQMFLRLLDVYKCEVPARYNNVKALWTEVHITSVLTPTQCYYDSCRGNDTIKQLLRRITSMIYHFVAYDCFYTMEFSPYTTWQAMFSASQKYLKSSPLYGSELLFDFNENSGDFFDEDTGKSTFESLVSE